MQQLIVEKLKATIGERVLFEGLSFAATSGESLAVTGPSGSGKSTLLAILAGFSNASEGRVQVDGPQGPRAVDWLVQSSPLLNRRTALDNTRLAARIHDGEFRHTEAEARELLSRLGLSHQADVPVFRLSGGERQRVAVARTVLANPSVVLADEPTASLDPVSRDAVVAEFLGLALRGSIVVIATHDQRVAGACSKRLDLTQGPRET